MGRLEGRGLAPVFPHFDSPLTRRLSTNGMGETTPRSLFTPRSP